MEPIKEQLLDTARELELAELIIYIVWYIPDYVTTYNCFGFGSDHIISDERIIDITVDTYDTICSYTNWISI